MQPQTYSVESGKVKNDQPNQAPIANDDAAKAAAAAADAIRLADTASNILPGAAEIGSNIANGVGSLFGSGAVEGLDLAASAPAMSAGYELGMCPHSPQFCLTCRTLFLTNLAGLL